MFGNIKDAIKVENKGNETYRFTCPGYFNKYMGKTKLKLIIRLDEHDTKPE